MKVEQLMEKVLQGVRNIILTEVNTKIDQLNKDLSKKEVRQ
jgi:hypothetical protein